MPEVIGRLVVTGTARVGRFRFYFEMLLHGPRFVFPAQEGVHFVFTLETNCRGRHVRVVPDGEDVVYTIRRCGDL